MSCTEAIDPFVAASEVLADVWAEHGAKTLSPAYLNACKKQKEKSALIKLLHGLGINSLPPFKFCSKSFASADDLSATLGSGVVEEVG